MRSVRGPIHVTDDTAEAEIALRRSHLREHIKHPVLIEPAIPKVGLGVDSHLELPGLSCGGSINADRGQSLQVMAALTGIDDVNGLVATFETVADERQQNAVGVLAAIEEGADMAIFAKLGPGKPDSFGLLGHGVARSCENLSVKFRIARLGAQPLETDRSQLNIPGVRRNAQNFRQVGTRMVNI